MDTREERELCSSFTARERYVSVSDVFKIVALESGVKTNSCTSVLKGKS